MFWSQMKFNEMNKVVVGLTAFSNSQDKRYRQNWKPHEEKLVICLPEQKI
jgi:hypothetical protein